MKPLLKLFRILLQSGVFAYQESVCAQVSRCDRVPELARSPPVLADTSPRPTPSFPDSGTGFQDRGRWPALRCDQVQGLSPCPSALGDTFALTVEIVHTGGDESTKC